MLCGMGSERWTAGDIPDQTGRTFVVTGANSGLGLETTRQLVRHGGHVVMAVRDEAKGRRALTSLGAGSAEVRRVDLVDLDSVRAFAKGIERVDVLVNNAGVMMPPRALSPQGHEIQFAGNHLGHFALTGLLLDRLVAGRDPRVVTVSSMTHRVGRIRFDDLTGARRYSPTAFYAQSKLANVLFGLELDRRLRAAGSPVRSLVTHPGYAATNLVATGSTGVTNLLMRIGNPVFAQSAAMGALPQLYAAVAAEAEGGQFIGPDGLAQNRGYPTVVRPAAAARDPETAKRLWALSEELTGVHFG
jgi:NAD(P)-dependent dehydrogenase (short-subunit alcohol dehydrogenase family)